MTTKHSAELRAMKGEAGEASRILNDFLDEHSQAFYNDGTPKDAIRIRKKYIAQIEAYIAAQVAEIVETVDELNKRLGDPQHGLYGWNEGYRNGIADAKQIIADHFAQLTTKQEEGK